MNEFKLFWQKLPDELINSIINFYRSKMNQRMKDQIKYYKLNKMIKRQIKNFNMTRDEEIRFRMMYVLNYL